MLPLRRSAGRPEVLPHFPQLKVPSSRQPGSALPEHLPLRAIYVLGEEEEGVPAITPMDTQEGTLALVRHTVAARLFDDELLAGHLAFCALIASDVPVKRLQYRRAFDDLPLVSEALRTDLGLTM